MLLVTKRDNEKIIIFRLLNICLWNVTRFKMLLAKVIKAHPTSLLFLFMSQISGLSSKESSLNFSSSFLILIEVWLLREEMTHFVFWKLCDFRWFVSVAQSVSEAQYTGSEVDNTILQCMNQFYSGHGVCQTCCTVCYFINVLELNMCP